MIGVTPVQGRPLCYLVKSRKGNGEHFVDLTDFQGNGSCTCPDWACRVVANMKRPHELLSNETLCWHLRRAHLENLSVQISLAAET
jgi:uncharacterized membrane protein